MLMGNLKSLHLLWVNLARNQRYRPYVTERDIETFSKRVANEGLSFLTTTLPELGKALDRFHANPWQWKYPAGFKPADFCVQVEVPFGVDLIINHYQVPLFLNSAFQSALKGDSVAVDCVRQLSYIFYKLEVDYDEELRKQFLVNFRKIDHDLATAINIEDNYVLSIVAVARRLVGRILCNEDPLDIRPRHGSGATACHTKNWDKYHSLRYFRKLDDVYPYSDYFFYSATHLADELQSLEEIANESVPRARVCLVPKDSRGPRVISCEPAELMFIQQGLMRRLYAILETHPLTRGQINFVDQGINRELAREASIDDSNATLDLSDASDRVSLQLVRYLFPEPWLRCLEACRSEETALPDGEIVKLNKFAPMGSSCCFPVEALCFWAIAQATLHILGYSNESPVYVYGDDIIIPSYCYDEVVRGLTLVGLKVNEHKSYKSGPFRESCGGDYHNGYDVTPVRVRKALTSKSTGIVTNADLANSFIAKFGYENSLSIISVIETCVGYQYPRSERPIPGTLRTSPGASNSVFFQVRRNRDYQRIEHRILGLSSKVLTKHLPDWGELLRKELTRGSVDDTSGKYENPLSIMDSKLDPGQYTDPRSVRKTWQWVWLG